MVGNYTLHNIARYICVHKYILLYLNEFGLFHIIILYKLM